MLDDATTGGSTPAPRCIWCSAVLPSDHEEVCPSCGATLIGDGETSVPGLTAIDAEAILRSARSKPKPRGGLLGWISGDSDDGLNETAAAPGSLEPPSADVRREMLRLELQAQVANAQAEVESMAADAAVEEGRSLALPSTAAADSGETAADTGTEAAAAASAAADEPGPAPEDEAPPA